MGQLSDKIVAALKAVQQLQIVTVVGKITVQNTFDPATRDIKIDNEQKALVSVIDLVQGDITHGIDPAFAPGQDAAIREFHERQVKLGNDIIIRNITMLKDIVSEIIDIAKKEDESGVT